MPSYDIPGATRSYEAAVDLSGSYLKFVKLSGAVLVAVSAATDKAVGVLQNKPNRPATGVFVAAERTSATVMISGVTRCIAAAAIAAGAPVYLDATGQVTTTAQAGQCVGVTETATTAGGQTISVLLKPLGSIV